MLSLSITYNRIKSFLGNNPVLKPGSTTLPPTARYTGRKTTLSPTKPGC